MSPLVTLLLGKVLEYLADHSDEIVEAIKEQFSSLKEDTHFISAVNELGYDPSEETLNKVSEVITEKGEDPAKLASLLVTKTVA